MLGNVSKSDSLKLSRVAGDLFFCILITLHWENLRMTNVLLIAGGFLSFKPSIPKQLMLDGEHSIESHFALVNYQVYIYDL